MRFMRRVCAEPRGNWTGVGTCPDLWELDSGDFAVIGRDITEEVRGALPKEVVLSPGEKVILLPRKVLVTAKPNIPDH